MTPEIQTIMNGLSSLTDGSLFVKNLHFEYIYVNERFKLDFFDRKLRPEGYVFEGKTDFDMFHKKDAKAIRIVDEELIRTKKESIRYQVVKTSKRHASDWHDITYKKPIFDSDKNVVGIMGQSILWKTIEYKKEKFQLTKREIESFACIAHGANATLTAQLLGVSTRSAEDYAQSLRNKFKFTKKTDLVSLAFQTKSQTMLGLIWKKLQMEAGKK